MILFALYISMPRPWHETDTYLVGIILAALFSLASFKSWKSYRANGILAGAVLGCLCAFVLDGISYRVKMNCIEVGMILGLVAGYLVKVGMTHAENSADNKSAQLDEKSDATQTTESDSPWFWISALAISGMSLGFFLATLLEMLITLDGILLIKASMITGGVIGAVIEDARRNTRWVQIFVEWWITTTLTAGTGAIIGWKIVLPILLFDINPDASSHILFLWSTYTCAAIGAVIGWSALAIRNSRRRRETQSLLPLT